MKTDLMEQWLMKCPLFSREGERRILSTLEFDDFSQLAEIEEGYAVEYKATWDDAVKKKLPKIISSFANAEGGWIFIGINDDHSYSGIPEERTDFDQTIAQIVHRHVSPIPVFETRFIRNADTDDGVLVIEVQEGVIPPYIADGALYVRVGSSSEHMSKADCHVVMELNRKAQRYREEIDAFCRRTVYLPPIRLNADGVATAGIPVMDVYLKRLCPGFSNGTSFAEFDATRITFEEILSNTGLQGYRCHHTHHSLLFKNSSGNCVDDVSPIIEVFYDGSIKLTVPFSFYQGSDTDEVIEKLQGIRPIRNTNLLRIINGSQTMPNVMLISSAVDKYLSVKGRTLGDYAFCYEFENVQGSVMYFDGASYTDYCKEHGFPFFGAVDARSEPVFEESYHEKMGEDERTDSSGLELSARMYMRLAEGFGFSVATMDEKKRNAVFEMMGFGV